MWIIDKSIYFSKRKMNGDTLTYLKENEVYAVYLNLNSH